MEINGLGNFRKFLIGGSGGFSARVRGRGGKFPEYFKSSQIFFEYICL